MQKKEISFNYDVILIEPQIEGNVGAIARICNNFKVNSLILVAPQIDHMADEAIARAMHSIKYLKEAKIYSSIADIKEEFNFLIGTSAKAGKSYNVLRQPLFPWHLNEIASLQKSKIGIVFGREDKGLLNEELKLCDFLVTIPVPGEHKVLNISHAVAIMLYELWKIKSQIESESIEERISVHKEREILFDLFNKITDTLTYPDYRKPIVKQTFRSIIGRSFASKEEIHALIGVFKSISSNML
ncbi:MAG: RNA methyltransferase [Candidatus Heimdallarchaeaceae archaeon]|jgi:TrmH family RNA methyltransferase